MTQRSFGYGLNLLKSIHLTLIIETTIRTTLSSIIIKKLNPDIIVGSSMGGYFAYQIGAQLKIKTVLFNPAVVGRSFEPKINDSNMKGTQNNVYLGKNDTVIPGKEVRKYFATEVGTFTYKQYNGEHRVPAGIFIDAIADAANIKEAKRLMSFDEFLDENLGS